MWSLDTFTLISSIGSNASVPVYALRSTPNERFVVSGGATGVQVWDVSGAEATALWDMPQHSEDVFVLLVDEARIISASFDETICVTTIAQ